MINSNELKFNKEKFRLNIRKKWEIPLTTRCLTVVLNQ